MTRQMWRQALLLAAKDVRILLADKTAIMFMMIFPLILVAGLSNVMGTAFQGPDNRIEIVLVTHEGPGSFSQAIIDSMQETGGGLAVRQGEAEVSRQAVLGGRLGGYIEFPAGFSDALLRGDPIALTVFVHPDAQTTKPALASVARSIADDITGTWIQAQATADLALRYGGPSIHDRLTEILRGSPIAASSGTVKVDFVQVGPAVGKAVSTYVMPGYVTMFVFFGLALSAEALIGERESQTLDRLIASRATRGSILLGKYLGNVARGTIQAAVLLGAGYFIFNLDLGYTPWATVAVTAAVVLCAAALGLAMATVARTRRAANALAVLASMVMAPLGGCWWSLYIMPAWMQTLARVTPHAWANSAYAKLLFFAAQPASILPEIGVLLLFTAGFGAVAGLRFRIEQ